MKLKFKRNRTMVVWIPTLTECTDRLFRQYEVMEVEKVTSLSANYSNLELPNGEIILDVPKNIFDIL